MTGRLIALDLASLLDWARTSGTVVRSGRAKEQRLGTSGYQRNMSWHNFNGPDLSFVPSLRSNLDLAFGRLK